MLFQYIFAILIAFLPPDGMDMIAIAAKTRIVEFN